MQAWRPLPAFEVLCYATPNFKLESWYESEIVQHVSADAESDYFCLRELA